MERQPSHPEPPRRFGVLAKVTPIEGSIVTAALLKRVGYTSPIYKKVEEWYDSLPIGVATEGSEHNLTLYDEAARQTWMAVNDMAELPVTDRMKDVAGSLAMREACKQIVQEAIVFHGKPDEPDEPEPSSDVDVLKSMLRPH